MSWALNALAAESHWLREASAAASSSSRADRAARAAAQAALGTRRRQEVATASLTLDARHLATVRVAVLCGGHPPPPPPTTTTTPPGRGAWPGGSDAAAAWPRLDKRLQPESWPAAAELLRAHATRRRARGALSAFTLDDHFAPPRPTAAQLGRRHFCGGRK